MIRRLLIALILVLVLSGCTQEKENKGLDGISKDLEQSWDDAKNKLDSYTKSSRTSALHEIEKLYILEYKVSEIDASASASAIEQRLNELGKDRWECYDNQRIGDSLHLFCKRRPGSVLEYLPYLPKVFG